MLIFLYGPDTFRSREKLNKIIERYKEVHKNTLNLKHFDGGNLDFEDLKNEFQIMPMFKEKKLLILDDVFANSTFKEKFLTNSERFVKSEDLILLYESKEIDSRDSLFVFLKKRAKFQEFKLLDGQRLKNWAKKEIERRGAKIDAAALERLIDFVGNDLWHLSNEIKKLAAFKKDSEINIKDVGLLVRSKIETDIFKTIDAIALKNKKQALVLLHQHLEKGDSPSYLLFRINSQFRNIIQIKDLLERGKALKSVGLHPFVVKKSCDFAQRFTLEELKKIYQKIFQVDYNIKTGKLDPRIALDLFVAEI